MRALEIYFDSNFGRGTKLDDFIFVKDTLRDDDKGKESKANGIKISVQITTRNYILQN